MDSPEQPVFAGNETTLNGRFFVDVYRVTAAAAFAEIFH
jgi:hypothetical protein